MATSKDGLWAPIAGFLWRRWRDAPAIDPEALDELRGILDAVPTAIVAQAQDGRVLAWNRAAERVLGWTKAEIAAQPSPFVPPRFVPADARAADTALRHRILAGNEVFRAPGRFLHANGETLHLLISAAPRRNAAGKIVGIVSILEEAVGTGRPVFDAPPLVAREAMQEPRPDDVPRAAPRFGLADDGAAPAARPSPDLGFDQPSRLLAKVIHDLRQPLHALSLLTGALERRVKEPGARELVDDAGAMIRALQATFDNLVDLARLEEGSVQTQPAAIPAGDILSPLTVEFAREAVKRNIAFHHVGNAAVIRVDPLLTQRLLRHLLANALRFAAREDGTRGKVLFGARRGGDRLRLVVADDGIGVAPDRHEAIFEPFVQSDEGRAAGGMGLGLAIAARLARLLDTEIRLESRPGKGSRFWIDVPLESTDR